MVGFVEGLTEAQLARTVHIPVLKETPLGEFPTLAAMINVLGEYHIQSHIEHLQEIMAELAAKGPGYRLSRRAGAISAGWAVIGGKKIFRRSLPAANLFQRLPEIINKRPAAIHGLLCRSDGLVVSSLSAQYLGKVI